MNQRTSSCLKLLTFPPRLGFLQHQPWRALPWKCRYTTAPPLQSIAHQSLLFILLESTHFYLHYHYYHNPLMPVLLLPFSNWSTYNFHPPSLLANAFSNSKIVWFWKKSIRNSLHATSPTLKPINGFSLKDIKQGPKPLHPKVLYVKVIWPLPNHLSSLVSGHLFTFMFQSL